VSAYANGGGFAGTNGNGNSGSGGNGGAVAHGGGGGGGGFAHSGGSSFTHTGGGGSFVHTNGGGGSFVHSNGGGHLISPVEHTSGYHGPAFVHSEVSAPHVFTNNNHPSPAYRGQAPLIDAPNVTISHNPTFPTFAVGGHRPNSGGEQNTQRSFTKPTSGWDRHWDRVWHGHHYHWNNGAWVIINDGYYPYADSYYYPSSSDVYPDMSYDYGDNNYAPSTSVVPAPAPIPSQAEDNIASDVQAALQSRGYYHGEIDGIVGDGTRGAIADFQKDNDLPVTGYITKSLLHALGL